MPTGGSCRGVNFTSTKSRFMKEWRTEVAFAPDYKQVVYLRVASRYGRQVRPLCGEP